MRLSCLPVSFFPDIIGGRMSAGEWARMGGEIGLNGIDLSILFLPDGSPIAAEALRQEIEASGMQVAMVTTYPDFTHPAARQRRRELAKAQEMVALAASLGAELVRVTAGQAHPDTQRDKGIAWAVHGLTELVTSTRKTGVTLVYENHSKPGAWRYTDFSEPPEVFLNIVQATRQVELGILFDTGNATAFSDDPVAMLDAVIDSVISVHVSDTAVRGALRPVLLGTGLTPFIPLFTRLKRAGWDGWLCMEEASFRGRDGIERAADFVRRTWADA